MTENIREPQPLNAVRDFHQLFGAYVGTTPAIPATDTCALRLNLLQEELNELAQAIQNNDIIEAADALTDIQYVLSGAILAFGLQQQFAALFAEVHRSNMSKACATREEAEATVAWYAAHKDMQGTIVEKDGVFIVLRVGDNKVLKSIKYTPANLAPIVDHPASVGLRAPVMQSHTTH